jgi:hypothetical protein
MRAFIADQRFDKREGITPNAAMAAFVLGALQVNDDFHERGCAAEFDAVLG